jgi:predicted alpha/beta hydrolase family esterase
MKTAIILHGMPSKEEYFDPAAPSPSNRHWLPWIQRQLILQDILAQTLEMPAPYAPDYGAWCAVFEKISVDENTTLIGHSCGGGFLVRWLCENKIKVGRVVLVAPWLDPDREDTTDFFDFTIDENLAARTAGLVILNSTDDFPAIQKSVVLLKEKIKNIDVRNLNGFGHFCYDDMKTDAFPALLEAARI